MTFASILSSPYYPYCHYLNLTNFVVLANDYRVIILPAIKVDHVKSSWPTLVVSWSIQWLSNPIMFSGLGKSTYLTKGIRHTPQTEGSCCSVWLGCVPKTLDICTVAWPKFQCFQLVFSARKPRLWLQMDNCVSNQSGRVWSWRIKCSFQKEMTRVTRNLCKYLSVCPHPPTHTLTHLPHTCACWWSCDHRQTHGE